MSDAERIAQLEALVEALSTERSGPPKNEVAYRVVWRQRIDTKAAVDFTPGTYTCPPYKSLATAIRNRDDRIKHGSPEAWVESTQLAWELVPGTAVPSIQES